MKNKPLFLILIILFVLVKLSIPKSSSAQGFFSCSFDSITRICEPLSESCDLGCFPTAPGCEAYNTNQTACENTIHPCECPLPTGAGSGSGIEWWRLYNAIGGTGAFGRLSQSTRLGNIITAFLWYLFPIAGLILLLYLIYGGYKLLTSAGNPKNAEAARHIMTQAVIGFIIIFLAFWIVQIVGRILGLTAVGGVFGTP